MDPNGCMIENNKYGCLKCDAAEHRELWQHTVCICMEGYIEVKGKCLKELN